MSRAARAHHAWCRRRVAGHAEVRFEPGLLAGLWRRVREAWPTAERVGLVADARVRALWPLPAPPRGLAVLRVDLPPGEAAKRRAVLARVQDALVDLRRDEPVLVLGGGAALDVGGLAAALLRRGLPWVALPSTVVAMADAALGGKVAVNHPRGKNLLGTFHPAARIWADPRLLETLPAREVRAGLAEVYKCARVGDPGLGARLVPPPEPGEPRLAEAIRRALLVKARLVARDPRDHGPRRALNLGHTVGHALEGLLGPRRLRHGEAVAIGMVVAARLAVRRGRLTAAEARRLAADLEALGLPVDLPAAATPEAVLERLAADKKRRPGRGHTFVLPLARGVEIHEDVRGAEIRAALKG